MAILMRGGPLGSTIIEFVGVTPQAVIISLPTRLGSATARYEFSAGGYQFAPPKKAPSSHELDTVLE